MNPGDIVIEGVVQADGTLTLGGSAKLPPGRVQVVVRPLPDPPVGDPFWDMMRSIWEGQRARGFTPRSAEQVEAERREEREHWEERLRAVTRLQEESRRLREQNP